MKLWYNVYRNVFEVDLVGVKKWFSLNRVALYLK